MKTKIKILNFNIHLIEQNYIMVITSGVFYDGMGGESIE